MMSPSGDDIDLDKCAEGCKKAAGMGVSAFCCCGVGLSIMMGLRRHYQCASPPQLIMSPAPLNAFVFVVPDAKDFNNIGLLLTRHRPGHSDFICFSRDDLQLPLSPR